MSSRRNCPEKEIILSYYDCLLRSDDVNLLRGSHWLNDAIIGFYFEYSERKLENTKKNVSNEILFVSPELTQLLKLTDSSDYPALLDSLNATQRNYVFFPLNNCDSREAAGGSHWSLLVFSRKEKSSFHLDSCRGTNRSVAKPFAKKIMDYLADCGSKNFEELQCPQQENGYDCGLFTLCLADTVLQHIQTIPEVRGCNFSGVGSIVRTKREELLDLIEQLKNIHEKKQ